jgi:DNA-binding LytR/AlgR family response regulator
MKTIIIEDEPLVARDLQKVIKEIDPTITIVTVLDSLKKCIAYFKSNPTPDLLFMDVQLSDGVSFDLFNEIQLDCPIIFTTAYDEYAIRAFKLNSIDYLLKPVDKNELKVSIQKFLRIKESIGPAFDIQDQVNKLIEQVSKPKGEQKNYKERFMAHAGKSYMIVHSDRIAYFQKESIIYIVTKEKEKFVSDFQTMEEIEDLIDPALFFRANRQFIVQANAIESFRADMYGKIVAKLKDNNTMTIDISREKAQAFKKWIQ